MANRLSCHGVLATALLAFALAVGATASAGQTDSTLTKLYTLVPASTFSEGCFPPCLCPVLISEDLRGIFKLTLLPTADVSLFDTYAVTDVNWRVKLGDKDVPITGSGTYQRGGEFALMHELTLDLAIDGNPPQHFDSGLVVGGSEFPTIDITVSLHGEVCFDTVIHVRAAPVKGCG